MNIELYKTLGVEIEFAPPDVFLKIKETLTRIGVVATYSNTLWQTCHILHKQNEYRIMHFKELIALDGKLKHEMTESDIADRNFIVYFLETIGLLKAKTDYIKYKDKPGKLKIIKSADKSKWDLKSKYNIGGGTKTWEGHTR